MKNQFQLDSQPQELQVSPLAIYILDELDF